MGYLVGYCESLSLGRMARVGVEVRAPLELVEDDADGVRKVAFVDFHALVAGDDGFHRHREHVKRVVDRQRRKSVHRATSNKRSL